MRFPAHLLPEVVATLTAAQSAVDAVPAAAGGQPAAPAGPLAPAGAAAASPALSPGDAAEALGREALRAAAMGAGGALRLEPVAPVDRRSLAKALRCARSLQPALIAGCPPAGLMAGLVPVMFCHLLRFA